MVQCNLLLDSSVKNLPANTGDLDSIPESGRSLEKEMATYSHILAWKILWMEEPSSIVGDNICPWVEFAGYQIVTQGQSLNKRKRVKKDKGGKNEIKGKVLTLHVRLL